MTEKTFRVEKTNQTDPIFQRVVDAQMALRYTNLVRDCSEETPKLPKLAEFIDKVRLEGQAGPMVDQTNTTDGGPTISLERAMQAIKSGEVGSLWNDKELLEMYFDPAENPDYDPETGETIFNTITQLLPETKNGKLDSFVVAKLKNSWGKAKELADAEYKKTHQPENPILPTPEPVSLEIATGKFKSAIIKGGGSADNTNLSTALAELLNCPLPQTELKSAQQVKVSRAEDPGVHEVNLGKAVSLIITQVLEQRLRVLPLSPDNPTQLSFSVQFPKPNAEESLRVATFIINANSTTTKPPNRNNIATLLSKPNNSREQIYLEEIQAYLKGANVDELTILLRDEKQTNTDGKW